jgi:hypothetical protein
VQRILSGSAFLLSFLLGATEIGHAQRLVSVASFSHNQALKDSVAGILPVVESRGIATSVLTNALQSASYHRDISDTAGLSFGLIPGTGVTLLPSGVTRVGSVLVRMNDRNTHTIAAPQDADELVAGQYGTVLRTGGISLTSATSTALHELTHSMIYRTRCFRGSDVREEDLVRAIEGAMASKVAFARRQFSLTVNAAVAEHGTSCIELLGLYNPISRFTMAYGTQSASEGETLSIVSSNTLATVTIDPARSLDLLDVVAGGSIKVDGVQVASFHRTQSTPIALASGMHAISVSVHNNFGFISEAHGTVVVVVASNHPPTAGFAMAAPNHIGTDGAALNLNVVPSGGVSVSFDAASRSFDPDGDSLTFEWRRSGVRIPTATFTGSSFTFSLGVGTHAIALIATDSRGAQSQAATGTIVVTEVTEPAWPVQSHDTRHTNQSLFVGPQAFSSPRIFDTASGGIYSTPVIDKDGTVYAIQSATPSRLFAFSPGGSVRPGWPFTAPVELGALAPTSPAIAPDGTIYAAFAHRVYAFNPTGSLKWPTPFEAEGGIYSSPMVGPDGTIYVSAVANGAPLYALNPDGSLKWRATGVDGRSVLALAADGAVFVPRINFGNNGFIAFNSNGTVRWSEDFGGTPVNPSYFGSAVIGSDGTVYTTRRFTSENSVTMLGLDPVTGGVRYQRTIPIPHSLAISLDRSVLAVTPQGILGFSLDLLTPTSIYTFPSPLGQASELAIGADGTLYLTADTAASTSQVFAISPEGILKSLYSSLASRLTSPAIAVDGTLHLGSSCCSTEGGKLYSFGPSVPTVP